MAKSAKHKKIRKKEKAKAQLKGGIAQRLSKAQNVIEPKLQSKKIILREQLKSGGEGEIITRKQQNIQDILSSLSHHNTNIKTGALGGLYELMTNHDHITEQHLGRIVDKIGILTSDVERSVRHENLRVAEALLAQVSEDQLQPFWNLLLSHLKCTLTNINSPVRQHCLAFIMLLMSYCPKLVVSSRSIILPAVLNLISSTTASKTRLKVDVSDKSSQIEERIRVLQVISSCLDLQRKSAQNEVLNNSSREITLSESNSNEDFHVPLYYSFGYEDETCRKASPMCSSFDFDMSGLDRANGDEANSSFLTESEGFLSKFAETCFPILCETWVEVAPSNKVTNSDENKFHPKFKIKGQERVNDDSKLGDVSHLSQTAVQVLQCIANVMDHLIVREEASQNQNNFTKHARFRRYKTIVQDMKDFADTKNLSQHRVWKLIKM